jgi:hypothetical protein
LFLLPDLVANYFLTILLPFNNLNCPPFPDQSETAGLIPAKTNRSKKQKLFKTFPHAFYLFTGSDSYLKSQHPREKSC